MKSYFVDTNIFLRFLIADNQKQYLLAKKLFQAAESGKIVLWTTHAVMLEIIWTLKSYYGLSSEKIQTQMVTLFSLEGLTIQNKELLLSALDLMVVKNVDFIDAYNYLLAQKENQKIISFDKDFDKLGKREEISKLV